MENNKLTKKEKKELRKLEWQEKAKIDERNAKIKKYSIWGSAILVILATIFGLIQIVNSPTTGNQTVAVAPG